MAATIFLNQFELLIFLTIVITVFITSTQSLAIFALHDSLGRLWPSSTGPQPLRLPNPAEDEMGRSIRRLIDRGQKMATAAHDRLSDKGSKPNKYRKLMVEELDHLEILLKRMETYLNCCMRNPFMKKLITYTKSDLELLESYFETIVHLYDQDDDHSMPVLTRAIIQLVAQTDLDIGFLSSKGHREYANKISDASGRLQRMFGDLKQNMDQYGVNEFSDRIKKLIITMVDFENLVLEAQKVCNINSVHH